MTDFPIEPGHFCADGQPCEADHGCVDGYCRRARAALASVPASSAAPAPVHAVDCDDCSCGAGEVPRG